MIIKAISSGELSVNSYFLINEKTREAVAIDTGEDYNLILDAEIINNFKIKAVLLTHAHFDHAGNCAKLQQRGVKIYISKLDYPKLLNSENLGEMFGRGFEKFKADYTFIDGEELNICDIKIKVLLTPGHTSGSATFIVGNNLFTGDTLFFESVGRTDFPTGNVNDLKNSIKKLFSLEGDYTVYTGHEEYTTLSHERKYNGFIDYD